MLNGKDLPCIWLASIGGDAIDHAGPCMGLQVRFRRKVVPANIRGKLQLTTPNSREFMKAGIAVDFSRLRGIF